MTKLTMRNLRKTQKGLTTVEYAIAGGLISGALIAAFTLLGGNIGLVINAISGALAAAVPNI